MLSLVTVQLLAVVVVVWCVQYLGTFSLAPVFTEEEFYHWFLPRPGIVDSYVVEVNCLSSCRLFAVYSTGSWFIWLATSETFRYIRVVLAISWLHCLLPFVGVQYGKSIEPVKWPALTFPESLLSGTWANLQWLCNYLPLSHPICVVLKNNISTK